MKRIAAPILVLLVVCIVPAFAEPAPTTAPIAIVISPSNPASLQDGIDSASIAKLKKVVIPAGVYRPAKPSGRYYLRFTGLADMEIDATGVTLLRSDPTLGGIEFANCRNVALRGLTLLNETPPFTQGKIEAIDPEGLWYDLHVADGYPDEFADASSHGFSGYLFDPQTRQWKAGSRDIFAETAEPHGPRTYRLHFRAPQGPPQQPVVVGDLMAFRGNGGTDIYLGNCQGMTIAGVTIKSGGGFCVHEADGEGGNHYSFSVSYGPRPAGATENPLISCNADAFHSSSVRQGPTLQDCQFQGMPDDGIAIHGSYQLVVESAGTTLILCPRGPLFRKGDPLRIYTKDGSFLGDATLKSVELLDHYKPPKPIENFRFRNSRQFVKITLDRPVSIEPESLVSDPAQIGSGYVIRNCTIRDHRARGMLLKADDGLVENNTIDGSTMAGIVLAPEVWWNEACYSQNVTVRGNRVRHVGYQNAGPWMAQAGAITLRGDAERPDRPAGLAPGHRHIIFENNTIADCDGLQMLISHAQDVLIAGNHFVNAQQRPSLRGADRGIDPTALIQIGVCKDVRLENNTFTNRGSAGKELVRALNPSDVKGLETGVRPEAAPK